MRVLSHLQGKEPPLEGCKLRKADLITQVKQLQEKLNHLIYSMNFQNIEAEDFKSQQPLAFSHVLENSSSDSCSTGEETDRSPPTFTEITWDLVDVTGTRESWIRSEMPHVSTGENEGLREGARVSLHSGCRALTHSQGPEPLQNALSTMDASWGSPEVVRKDSTLELLPSLPLTPCSAASLLQADQSGLLCSPGGSPAVKGPGWSESPSAADRTPSASHHVQRTSVVGTVPRVGIRRLSRFPGCAMGLSGGLWCHSGSHCWLTSWQACGWVWALTAPWLAVWARSALCRTRPDLQSHEHQIPPWFLKHVRCILLRRCAPRTDCLTHVTVSVCVVCMQVLGLECVCVLRFSSVVLHIYQAPRVMVIHFKNTSVY